jgi:hypothetical protein
MPSLMGSLAKSSAKVSVNMGVKLSDVLFDDTTTTMHLVAELTFSIIRLYPICIVCSG